MRADLVARMMSGLCSALADSGVGDISINIPINITIGQGIQIWTWEVEFTDGTWFAADNKTLTFILSRSTVTAETYINNQDVLAKIKVHSELATNGMLAPDLVLKMDFYPARQYFSNVIHVGIINNTGAAQTIYSRIWYSGVLLSRDEVMGLLTNQGVP